MGGGVAESLGWRVRVYCTNGHSPFGAFPQSPSRSRADEDPDRVLAYPNSSVVFTGKVGQNSSFHRPAWVQELKLTAAGRPRKTWPSGEAPGSPDYFMQ